MELVKVESKTVELPQYFGIDAILYEVEMLQSSQYLGKDSSEKEGRILATLGQRLSQAEDSRGNRYFPNIVDFEITQFFSHGRHMIKYNVLGLKDKVDVAVLSKKSDTAINTRFMLIYYDDRLTEAIKQYGADLKEITGDELEIRLIGNLTPPFEGAD